MTRWARENGARLAVLMLASGAPSCVPAQGTVDASGYKSQKYAYGVDAGPNGLMSTNWRLDNFQTSSGILTAKTSGDYAIEYVYDVDNDGRWDFKETTATYELRFLHRTRRARISLRLVPLPASLRETELRALMQGLIDDMAGGNYERGVLTHEPEVIEKRYAAAVKERGAATLAGMQAYSATVDIANLDQLRLTPGARESSARLVIARTPFAHHASDPKGVTRGTFALLMIVSYINLPDDFSRNLGDFEAFLNQIRIGTSKGYVQRDREVVAPLPTSAPVATQPPALAPASPPAPASAPAKAP